MGHHTPPCTPSVHLSHRSPLFPFPPLLFPWCPRAVLVICCALPWFVPLVSLASIVTIPFARRTLAMIMPLAFQLASCKPVHLESLRILNAEEYECITTAGPKAQPLQKVTFVLVVVGNFHVSDLKPTPDENPPQAHSPLMSPFISNKIKFRNSIYSSFLLQNFAHFLMRLRHCHEQSSEGAKQAQLHISHPNLADLLRFQSWAPCGGKLQANVLLTHIDNLRKMSSSESMGLCERKVPWEYGICTIGYIISKKKCSCEESTLPASKCFNHLGHLASSEWCEAILILILGTPVSQREFIALLT